MFSFGFLFLFPENWLVVKITVQEDISIGLQNVQKTFLLHTKKHILNFQSWKSKNGHQLFWQAVEAFLRRKQPKARSLRIIRPEKTQGKIKTNQQAGPVLFIYQVLFSHYKSFCHVSVACWQSLGPLNGQKSR